LDTSAIAIGVTLATAAGLAVLATGATAYFRRGRGAGEDWTPLLWAVAILLQLTAYWWRFREMAAPVDTWTLPALAFVASRTAALLLAAALILPLKRQPAGETVGTGYAVRGRWALVALAVFHLLAIAGLLLAGEWLLGEAVRTDLALLVLAAAGLLGSPRVAGLAAGAYALATVWSLVQPGLVP